MTSSGELEAPMHTFAQPFGVAVSVRRRCPAGSITRNKGSGDASACPPPLRVHVGQSFCYFPSPLCPCPPSRPKMERKWKCKPGEANAVSQVPVCRSPTPSSPLNARLFALATPRSFPPISGAALGFSAQYPIC
ncbi:predicted protein [Chaetomium globosum CBS 148.51]|uniref:Uncharacterized protein n=1 Tax=Chaetomium globosum (strain ATCC 6205 / CBS 148.51 / DSM 1962 / NBRC 6347 / NRRL 1970) TaxID=306901 RepID=Q2H4E4_CHAGB|nr:uncharacterized protein CHGG_06471 [Chaetomium globosum CBS 148.51]EAQ89852.1 predicted protein [Chaetomium globosum CBS 148.51]